MMPRHRSSCSLAMRAFSPIRFQSSGLSAGGGLGGPENPLDAGEHGRERGVQLVRKPGGEHAEGSHPVRLRELRLRSAPLGYVAPNLHDLRDVPERIQDRRRVNLVDARLSAREPPLVDPKLRLPRPEAGERGAVVGPAGAGGRLTAGGAEHLVPFPARAPEKRVVGGDHLAPRVEDDDRVVDAVDYLFELFPLIADLVHEPGGRCGHHIELPRQPRDRVRSLLRHAAVEVALGDEARRRLEMPEPPEHDDAYHRSDPGNQGHHHEPASRCHPANVAVHRGPHLACVHVHDQNAVDRPSRVVAACGTPPDSGSGSSSGEAPPGVSMTRLDVRSPAGSLWHAWQVGESMGTSLSSSPEAGYR